MAIKRPTPSQLRDVAHDLGMTLTDDDLRSYLDLMAASFGAYDAVEAMPDYLPEVNYPRTPGYQPEGAENPYAWYVKTTVKGTPSGKLAGKTVVLKDNICLAGVPMMNGASTLKGYVPDLDATVVTRILDAGGTIVGKAHCETSASRVAATPTLSAPSTIRAGWGFRPADRHRGRPRSWPPVRSIWRSGRPGRVHTHPICFLRHLRHEAHPWAHALHRHHAD